MSRWIPDLQPRFESDQRTWMEWLVRNFEKLSRWTSIQPEPEVVSYGASITFNAGDGTPHGDLNATDFTGHQYAAGTALTILSNAVVTFGHNAIGYIWTGPTGVTVGLGGSHTAVATDLTPIGTADHNILTNRNLADQHPTAAITNLDNDQAVQDSRLTTLEQHPPRTDNPHQVTHDQLVGQSPEPDPHPVYQKKLPGMAMFGDADNFTLNTTASKLVNYTQSGEWNWTDQDDIDPVNGEMTIPQDGVYSVVGAVIGYQGNDTKEEWMEMRLHVVGANPSAGEYRVAEREIPTDKTDIRSLLFTATRLLYANDVLSLWVWGSTGLGTFDVDGTTFEVIQIAEIGDLAP